MSATIQTTIPAGTYVADPVHSSFGFQVRHNGVQLFRSRFTHVGATVRSDGETLSIEGQAKVESIDLADEQFKGHILSDDFFAADKHPEIAFRSTAVRRTEDGALDVEGELTIRGTTNHVTAKGTLGEPGVNLGGKTVVGLTLETEVDRTAYGLNWNAELPNGAQALANEVRIVVEAELVKDEA